MRRISLVLLVSGIAWLAFKAEYLGMDTSDSLKTLIVTPGVVLLIAAAILASKDTRERIGGALLAIGGVAVLWLVREPPPNGGWTFGTPYTSIVGVRDTAFLHGPTPLLVAAAILLPSLGVAILSRQSPLGALLIGAAVWCAMCFSPSRWIDAEAGMPNRRSYYYSDGRPLPNLQIDPLPPILLGLAGIGVFARRKGSGNTVPTPLL